MIPLIKSTFYREKQTKRQVINFIKHASQLSFGKECEKFEANFAKYQKRKYCLFMNSGSSANLAMIQSLMNLGKIKKGDLVGFSALTWSTNVMPLIQLGLNAVPIDVELTTLNVSSAKLRLVLGKYPLRLVFLTSLLGFCDDIDEIRKICEEKKIILIEDNCESLGSVYKGKLLGNYGMASTFSFYVGHHMSTIEGGAICTDSEQLATMIGLVRAHGWDRNLDEKRQTKIRARYKINSTFYSRYTFYDLGYNFRPQEINGFIGNTQLPHLPKTLIKRNRNFLKLAKAIYKHEDKYYPVQYNHLDFVSNFAVPVICRTQKIRDRLVEQCDRRVEIRPIVGGDISSQPFFKKYMKAYAIKTPNARLIHQQGLYFGNNPELTSSEINAIISIFSS